jgi:hypothetical protein
MLESWFKLQRESCRSSETKKEVRFVRFTFCCIIGNAAERNPLGRQPMEMLPGLDLS